MNGVWAPEEGQDIAEYAVMLAAIPVIVVGTPRLIGSNTITVSPTWPARCNRKNKRENER